MRGHALESRPIVSSFVLLLTLAGLAPLTAAAGFDDSHRIWTVHAPFFDQVPITDVGTSLGGRFTSIP
jgi:hypothetical protein